MKHVKQKRRPEPRKDMLDNIRESCERRIRNMMAQAQFEMLSARLGIEASRPKHNGDGK